MAGPSFFRPFFYTQSLILIIGDESECLFGFDDCSAWTSCHSELSFYEHDLCASLKEKGDS